LSGILLEQFDDPDYDKYNKQIDDWVKQVCPLG